MLLREGRRNAFVAKEGTDSWVHRDLLCRAMFFGVASFVRDWGRCVWGDVTVIHYLCSIANLDGINSMHDGEERHIAWMN